MENQRPVVLAAADREELVRVTTTGVHPASVIGRARVLLALDASVGEVGSQEVIAARVGVSTEMLPQCGSVSGQIGWPAESRSTPWQSGRPGGGTVASVAASGALSCRRLWGERRQQTITGDTVLTVDDALGADQRHDASPSTRRSADPDYVRNLA
jgi:hypothetical protein